MTNKARVVFASFSILLLLAGCSRTLDKVAQWKTEGHVAKLIRALEDPQVDIRAASAQALGELQAAEAVAPIAALFNDAATHVVRSSVLALIAIGTDAATTNLIDALKLAYPDVRAQAAAGLGQLQARHALAALIETLDDAEPRVGAAAAIALGILSDEQASKPLAAKLASDVVELRMACAKALGSTQGRAAVKGLVASLGDRNPGIRATVVSSLVSIGQPAASSTRDVLKSADKKVRQGAVSVLKQVQAIPTAGRDAVWYQLAIVSIDRSNAVKMTVVEKLAGMGGEAVEPLLEAATHSESDIREHAFRALETIGEPCAAAAEEAATDRAGPAGRSWFNSRTAWSGAPSWHLDLWGAVAALSPDFAIDRAKAANLQGQGRNASRVITAPEFEPTREYIPLLIRLLGDTATPPPQQPAVDEFGMPVVKKAVDRFRGEANQQMARELLIAAQERAVFPLIAAMADRDTRVAGHAAEILSEIGDARAVEPLIQIVAQKVQHGEKLADSPFYKALQKMDDPAAEPVLRKVQPNTDRAIRLFERQFDGVRVNFVDSLFNQAGTKQLAFRLGYVDDLGQVGSMDITFAMDGQDDWAPAPPLPDQLPQ